MHYIHLNSNTGVYVLFFFSSRRRHTRYWRDWSSDVCSSDLGGPLNINSHLVAPGLTMIGEESGCRHLDRVHSYLNNLHRLGLIWFSREELEELSDYQVLEAQPEVTGAMEKAGRGAKTVRRSIHLTPFGEDFCRMC